MRGNEKGQVSVGMVVLSIVAIILLLVGLGTFYVINAGERGILLTWGNPDPIPRAEGLHFKIPIAQTVKKMDVKTLKYEAELTAASQDLQDVKTKIALNYRIDASKTPQIYQEIGLNYADKIIYPLEQEVNKAITAQYTAEELITKREEVREKMKSLLYERLISRNIIIEEVSIINFAFSESFTTAIENKVTAEQNALAEKNRLAQIEYQAQQRIAQAEGEARAIQIQAEAIKVQGGKEYVELQAIQKWDGKLPTFMMGSEGAVPFVNIPTTTQ